MFKSEEVCDELCVCRFIETFLAELNNNSKLVQKEQIRWWTVDCHYLFTLKYSLSE